MNQQKLPSQGQSKQPATTSQPVQNPPPQVVPNNQNNPGMAKSPSSSSTTSNNSSGEQAKFSPNLFNMFGTNVPASQPNTQQAPMPKQNIPGAGMTSPGAGMTSPVAKSPQVDSFANIW